MKFIYGGCGATRYIFRNIKECKVEYGGREITEGVQFMVNKDSPYKIKEAMFTIRDCKAPMILEDQNRK